MLSSTEFDAQVESIAEYFMEKEMNGERDMDVRQVNIRAAWQVFFMMEYWRFLCYHVWFGILPNVKQNGGDCEKNRQLLRLSSLEHLAYDEKVELLDLFKHDKVEEAERVIFSIAQRSNLITVMVEEESDDVLMAPISLAPSKSIDNDEGGFTKKFNEKQIKDNGNRMLRKEGKSRKEMPFIKRLLKAFNIFLIFRFLNLIRAIITTCVGTVTAVQTINGDENSISSEIRKLGGLGFLYATMVFLYIDLLICCMKLIGEGMRKRIWWINSWTLWKSTEEKGDLESRGGNNNIANKSFVSIWRLIADYDLLLDLLPLLMNVVLKIYGFRFNEIYLQGVVVSGDENRLKNLILLWIFVGSIVFVLLSHYIRLLFGFAKKKDSKFLISSITAKFLLLLLDITTQSLFLYNVLVTMGDSMFEINSITGLTLSVVCSSPFASVMSNFVVNFFLHFGYLKMIRSFKVAVTGISDVKMHNPRIFRRALKRTWSFGNTFFAFISLYNTIVIAYLLVVAFKIISAQVAQEFISKGFWSAEYGNMFSPARIALNVLLWINWIANYAFGCIACALWIVFRMQKKK